MSNVLEIAVCPFVLFHLAFVMSSLLRFTDSDYLFGIFKPSPLLIFQTFFYRSLGITCKKISGYAKGYGHNAGDVISYDQKPDHAWNVVELDGTWQFIETTWGAGSADKNKKFNKKFIQPSEKARQFGIEFPNHPYEMITVENACTITVESKADILRGVLCHL